MLYSFCWAARRRLWRAEIAIIPRGPKKVNPKPRKNFFITLSQKLDRKESICYNGNDEGVSSTCFPLPSHHLTSYRPASAGFYLHKGLQKLYKLEPSSQLPDIFPDFFIFLQPFLFFYCFFKKIWYNNR